MATVFLAEDEQLGRLVAIKRLHGESTDEVARRFQREARLGAALNHPNVVAVYDIASDDEGTLIVMEYVEGETLRDEVSDGPLPPERAIAILRGVAAALDYAHENGVVHRDVKPANVLIRQDGTVKLADLGIATAAEQSKITRPGSVLGTAAYMAPERLDGRPGGPAVDVYALAAVAFEMLGGRKAYEGTTPLEVAHKVVNEPTPDLRRVQPDAPAELAEALKRGLAWEPDERPATAGELVAAIEAALPEAAATAAIAPTAPLAAATAREPSPDAETPAAPPDGGTEGESTPVRVLPPERVHTRPARKTAVRNEVRTPSQAMPDKDDEPRSRLPLIAAVAACAVLLAIGLIALAGGSDDEQTPSGDRDQAERVAPSESGSDERSADEEGGSAPATPAEPEGNAAPAAGTPAATVNDFYQRAARDDYQGAWALLTPRGRAQLGSLSSFSAGQSSLESISFPKLKGKETGDTATVQLHSKAVHTQRVDQCKGTIDLVRQGGDWRLDGFHIAGCKQSPRQ
jgi:eukaryotic-like serine/threonine-protein kinase